MVGVEDGDGVLSYRAASPRWPIEPGRPLAEPLRLVGASRKHRAWKGALRCLVQLGLLWQLWQLSSVG